MEPTTQEVLDALEQAIQDVCSKAQQNAISDRYRELIDDDANDGDSGNDVEGGSL